MWKVITLEVKYKCISKHKTYSKIQTFRNYSSTFPFPWKTLLLIWFLLLIFENSQGTIQEFLSAAYYWACLHLHNYAFLMFLKFLTLFLPLLPTVLIVSRKQSLQFQICSPTLWMSSVSRKYLFILKMSLTVQKKSWNLF